MEGPDFYPEDIKPDAMLAYYAERLPTVEINNTFYRMPKKDVLENWAQGHTKGLPVCDQGVAAHHAHGAAQADEAADSVAYLYTNLAALNAKRGPVLFQLPPYLKKDLPRLTGFLAAAQGAPRRVRVPQRELVFRRCLRRAQNHRHGASALRTRRQRAAASGGNRALGYVRLRLETYSDADLEQWADRLVATAWRETYAYFMHETTAPGYAQTLMRFGSSLG